jgi:ATP-binding cassette subfamily B protein
VGRTTLVIAHRLATITNADRIIVVTENGISEQGRHDELVAAGGIYSRLHEAQFSRA